jgi:anti-sigma factor RsiW
VSPRVNQIRCDPALISVYALGAVPANEVPALEAHVQSCDECRARLTSLRPIVDSFAYWPNAVLSPSDALREARDAHRSGNALDADVSAGAVG